MIGRRNSVINIEPYSKIISYLTKSVILLVKAYYIALYNLLRLKKPKAKPRENHGRFPTIASLTRDILTILATSVGVERLFNTTRDIYYYRRGRIKSKTIEELILFLYSLRFDLELYEVKELKRFFSLNEIEALREEKDEKLNNIKFE
ncbi:hypothetical protein N7505_009751 [Penicillium chrysogenum]|uniref:HAT C-terminal dimerisation domain-containing protein n=1 Tax=Penicillium chrysogenum TaxID=5076 RepID=A0ABQ8WA35_PENCH|nr:hypothetical protein N7505_009751 [Penicillium chrysogenum]